MKFKYTSYQFHCHDISVTRNYVFVKHGLHNGEVVKDKC